MSTLIFGVELRKWIDSIHFFQYEAIHFLEKKRKYHSYGSKLMYCQNGV